MCMYGTVWYDVAIIAHTHNYYSSVLSQNNTAISYHTRSMYVWCMVLFTVQTGHRTPDTNILVTILVVGMYGTIYGTRTDTDTGHRHRTPTTTTF